MRSFLGFAYVSEGADMLSTASTLLHLPAVTELVALLPKLAMILNNGGQKLT